MLWRAHAQTLKDRWQHRRSVALADQGIGVTAAAPGRLPQGWSADDLVWERQQEQAAVALRGGDVALPQELWGEALELGQRLFQRGDPRLACSMTNQALVLRRRNQVHQAQQMFQRARDVWGESWRWIGLMRPQDAGLDDDGQLHLYDRAAQAAFKALVARGRAATDALERLEPLGEDRLAQWLAERPRRLCDVRKLLAGVLLIAPHPL